ncbi:hypothetical protein D018_3252 [Vibrio parahaemolyticus VP2007-007]|nr:hypothetical protein D018_3252 [Vibrio parahaemolyticus VP2007-007]
MKHEIAPFLVSTLTHLNHIDATCTQYNLSQNKTTKPS